MALHLAGRTAIDQLTRDAIAQADDDEIRSIVEDVCRATNMGFAALARVTDTRWIACQVADKIEFGLDPGNELDVSTTICNEIRESGQAVVIDHITIDAGWRTHPTPTIYGFESYVSFPVVLSDGTFWGHAVRDPPAAARGELGGTRCDARRLCGARRTDNRSQGCRLTAFRPPR